MQRAKQAARDRLDTLCGWGDEQGGSDMAAEQVRSLLSASAGLHW